LPEMATVGNLVYITLPQEGRIAVVDLEKTEVVQYLDVGGQPTRIVVIQKD